MRNRHDWTPDEDERLLSCDTEEKLRALRKEKYPGLAYSTLDRRHRRLRAALNHALFDKVGAMVRKAIADYGFDEDSIEGVSNLKIKKYQMGSKDAEGNPQITDLEGVTFTLRRVEPEPQWDLINYAKSVTIRPLKIEKPTRKFPKVIYLADHQIGFRELTDGTFDPFHDERVMAIQLQIVREEQPDRIVIMGDFLDFPAFSKYEQEPAFQRTTQRSLDRAYEFLCQLRANAPHAEIVFVEGNHDRRLPKFILRNGAAAFGLTQAKLPQSLEKLAPLLSLPHILHFDAIGVEYVSGYPAATHWLSDHLKVAHGRWSSAKTSNTKAALEDERCSVIFAHTHRFEAFSRTVNTRNGSLTFYAFSVPCSCRIDGAVPSVKGSTDYFGNPITSYENWQQGLAIGHVSDDDLVEFTPIFVKDGRAMFNGKEYRADQMPR